MSGGLYNYCGTISKHKKFNGDFMTNSEYEKKISEKIETIQKCIEDTKDLYVRVIGKTILDFDLCFSGLMNRTIQLAEGFIKMIDDRNLTCAGALLRLQIDNCLRLYAINIAENEQKLVEGLLEGKRVEKFKDKKGNFMKDAYLKKNIKQYDANLETVYDYSYGFIHISETNGRHISISKLRLIFTVFILKPSLKK